MSFPRSAFRLQAPGPDPATRVSPSRASAKALALVALANLLYPLYVSLAMLLPRGVPTVQAIALLIPAGVCLVELAAALRMERRAGDLITRPRAVYRYVLPFMAAIVLTAGSLALLAGWEVALYAPVAFIIVMFIVGSHNAWSLLLRAIERVPEGERSVAPCPPDRR